MSFMFKMDFERPRSAGHTPTLEVNTARNQQKTLPMQSVLLFKKTFFHWTYRFFFLYQGGSRNSFYSPNYPWNAAQDSWALLLNSSFPGSFPVRCGDSLTSWNVMLWTQGSKSSQVFHDLSWAFNTRTQIPEAYNMIFFPRQSVTCLISLQNFILR